MLQSPRVHGKASAGARTAFAAKELSAQP